MFGFDIGIGGSIIVILVVFMILGLLVLKALD